MISAAYLRGAIGHAIARTRALLEISQESSALELRDLQRVCTNELNAAVFRLVQAQSALEKGPETVETVGRVYQAMAKKINDAERLGVFALKNQSPDDIELNRLLDAICMEIGYPLIPPTISHTSQKYFEISPTFNLLRVPLIEGRYFLHLADLYHELCHPLLSPSGITNPKVDPLSEAFLKLKTDRGRTLDQARMSGERRRAGPDLTYRYALWRKCWIETWTEEFLCDAFGAYCAGPAYGWTHYHLCFRRNQALYHVPEAAPTSHPDDVARMSVILAVLQQRGFEIEAKAIGRAWADYAASTDFEKSTAFELCYPRDTLNALAQNSVDAFMACGIVGLPTDNLPPIAGMLQDAWHMFWSQTEPYETWESDARQSLVEQLA